MAEASTETSLGEVKINQGGQTFTVLANAVLVEFSWAQAQQGGAVLELEVEADAIGDVRPQLKGWSPLTAFLVTNVDVIGADGVLGIGDVVVLRRSDGLEVARTLAPPTKNQALPIVRL